VKTLDNLVRLHDWQVDEKRRALAALEQLGRDLRVRVTRLDAELAAERRVAAEAPPGSVNFPAYAAAIGARRAVLEQSIADVDRQVEEAREEVSQAFRELKKYEHVRAGKKQRIRVLALRRAQTVLDEVAINMYRRGRAQG